MATAPPIAPGHDMLRPMSRFTHLHGYSDNCSCPIAEHIQAMALIGLSCACKRTEWLKSLVWVFKDDFSKTVLRSKQNISSTSTTTKRKQLPLTNRTYNQHRPIPTWAEQTAPSPSPCRLYCVFTEQNVPPPGSLVSMSELSSHCPVPTSPAALWDETRDETQNNGCVQMWRPGELMHEYLIKQCWLTLSSAVCFFVRLQWEDCFVCVCVCALHECAFFVC